MAGTTRYSLTHHPVASSGVTRSRSRTYSYPFSGGRAGGSLLGAGAASAAAAGGGGGGGGGAEGAGSAAGHSLTGDEVAALLLSAFFSLV